jgi:hypothetical protein
LAREPGGPPRVPRAGTRRAEAAREGVVLGIVPRPWIGRGPIAVGWSAVALAGSSLARGAARCAPRATILAKAALVGTAVGAEAAAGVARGHRDAHASAHLAGRLREILFMKRSLQTSAVSLPATRGPALTVGRARVVTFASRCTTAYGSAKHGAELSEPRLPCRLGTTNGFMGERPLDFFSRPIRGRERAIIYISHRLDRHTENARASRSCREPTRKGIEKSVVPTK